MGIRPKSGSPTEGKYRIDGSHIANGLVEDSRHTGEQAGQAIVEISAQADSANKGTAELAKRVTALENRSTVTKDPKGRIQTADPAADGDAATKRYVDETAKKQSNSAVLTTGDKTGSWAPWNKTTCPPWLTIGASSLTIPEGRWRIEVLKGQVIIYENGALKDRAPAGWDGVILGSSQVYDGTGNATLIVTKLY
ncbi:hypothetical protein HMPREF3158_05390 [Corynebacterium sp. HMSC06G04]|uniref:hypothetical protein n=1 Tax=Corynebacterium sp. HMSC06G04 TaxID=1581126 RepID=UPI0008A2AD33|nr:hypothetical protein [Corynebacterium sp. HMSC06G04]OFT46977.1 hypothetical protein HMPREF3158_05390 [Corynebacterium sp. HMSC06G04]